MTDDLNQLDKFPFLEDALKLPADQFSHFVKGFLNYSSNCDYAFLPEKISEWCEYLKCENNVCKYNYSKAEIATTTILPILSPISGYCFDIWFCPPPWFSEVNFYCMGVICFVLCLVALVLNVVFIPSFTFYGHRHGADIFLTALSASDILQILFLVFLRCLPYIRRSHESQVLFYSQFIAKTVPFSDPLLTFFESLSSWILCCILFERYLFQRYGKHSQMIISTKSAVVTITILTVSLFSFACVKFFELEITESDVGLVSVRVTETGQLLSFHDIVTHLVKVPVEFFVPLLIYVVLLTMMYTYFGEQGILSYQSSRDRKNKELIKNFIIVNETDRENRIMFSVVFVSTFASISTFLCFVHHVLSTEGSHPIHSNVHYLRFSAQIISVLLVFIKPLFYVYISPFYCRGIRRYFAHSLPDNDEEGTSVSMTFEQTIANQMRESISYRRSLWSSKIQIPEWISNI